MDQLAAAVTGMVEALTDNARMAGDRGVKAEKPVLKAETAIGLAQEVRELLRYLQEHRIQNKAKWFPVVRNIAKSRAKAAVEDMIIRDFGGEEAYNAALANPRVDWEVLWQRLMDRWRIKAGYEGTTEVQRAIEQYGKVLLRPGHSAEDVEQFLLECEELEPS